MNIIVGPTIVIKVFLLRHRLWMPICLKTILFLLHCSEKHTFLLSFIYTCAIIWPPAPFESCYLARNLKEVARAWSSDSRPARSVSRDTSIVYEQASKTVDQWSELRQQLNRTISQSPASRQRGAVSPVVGRTLCTPAARVRVPG